MIKWMTAVAVALWMLSAPGGASASKDKLKARVVKQVKVPKLRPVPRPKPGPTASVPELDAGGAVGGLVLLLGGVSVLAGRRRRQTA